MLLHEKQKLNSCLTQFTALALLAAGIGCEGAKQAPTRQDDSGNTSHSGTGGGDDSEAAGNIDHDGDGITPNGGDCDDNNANIHPYVAEVCDGVDNNCDGTTDGADAADAQTWYADADGDGYGDPDNVVSACSAEEGFVASSGDCDDSHNSAHPGGTDSCNGIDDDCSGFIDDGGDCPYPVRYCDCPGSAANGSAFMFAEGFDESGDGWSHDEAEAVCESSGYRLLKSIDEDEWRWVEETIASNWETTYYYSINDFWWIGLRCVTSPCSVEANWEWPDGSAASDGYYPSWLTYADEGHSTTATYELSASYPPTSYDLAMWSTLPEMQFDGAICKAY